MGEDKKGGMEKGGKPQQGGEGKGKGGKPERDHKDMDDAEKMMKGMGFDKKDFEDMSEDDMKEFMAKMKKQFGGEMKKLLKKGDCEKSGKGKGGKGEGKGKKGG